jgi:DNA-binding NarL/FixJ family response regulator
MGPKVVRVGLVESHTLLRDAIRTLLNESGEILVVGEASDAAGVLALIAEQKPDALLLVMNGNAEHALSMLSRISEIADQTNVLVASDHDDPVLHTHAIELGARGVVMLDQPGTLLVKALRKVCEGEVWLDRVRTAGMVNRLTRRRGIDQDPEMMKIESLTTREREIVTLVTEGLTNKEIAERLFISEATARNHLTSILDKLDVPDRFHLAVYAFRRGLVLCPQTPAMLRAAAAMNQVAHRSAHVARRPVQQRAK